MDADALTTTAAERAEELPGAELTHPFGPEWDVYKVRGRVFLLLPLDGTGRVTVKSHPDDVKSGKCHYRERCEHCPRRRRGGNQPSLCRIRPA